MFKILIKILILLAVISFILSVLSFISYSKPKRYITQINPQMLDLSYKEIKLKTTDNIIIDSWFIENKKSNKAVILLHGWARDKGDILSNTIFMAKKYNLLYIDFRAMGKSGGGVTTGGYKEMLDIKAAVEFLKEKGFKDIALYGYSMGGFTSIMYLIYNDDIKFVVSDSPYDNIYSVLEGFFKIYYFLSKPILWFINIEYKVLYGKFITELCISKNIDKIKKPVLFICGTRDDICYNEKIKNYQEQNKNIKVVLLEDFSHNETMYYKGYENIIFEFMDRNF